MSKSILIADDDQDTVDLLTFRCQALGLQVHTAANALRAMHGIEENRPDVVILDVDMPFGDGLRVREMMLKDEKLSSIPVIILTGSTNEKTVRKCHEHLSYYILKCPNVWSRLEPVLLDVLGLERAGEDTSGQQELTPSSDESCRGTIEIMDAIFAILGTEVRESFFDECDEADERSDAPWVLLIEDDDDFAFAVQLRLRDYGLQVIRAAAGAEGYRQAFTGGPRAIILDYELPEGNGDYVLQRLKESSVTRDIPVIALTGRRETGVERQMRGLGVCEFLNKPVDWKRLRKALTSVLDCVTQTS
jgi:DNA-binding response OmpR family regulator